MKAAERIRGALSPLLVWMTLALAPVSVLAQPQAVLAGSGTLTPLKLHGFADILLEGDSVSGSLSFQPLAQDIGRPASIYVAARIRENGKEQWFRREGGRWLPWDGTEMQLRPDATRRLTFTETVPVLEAQPLFAGDYELYAGYRVEGGPLLHTRLPFGFAVASRTGAGLLRFNSAEVMEAYVKDALQKSARPDFFLRAELAASATADSAAVGTGRTSGTNLQESGVDEADIAKVDGDLLYMLKNCGEGACIDVQRLQSAGAGSTALASYKLDTAQHPDGLYLVQSGIGGRKTLVTVGGQNLYWPWFRIWGWQDGKTELEFLDISNPASINRSEKLAIDGALVASRRVGDTLYLVTRYTPAIEGYRPFPVDKVQQERNAALLAATTLPAIMPRVVDSRARVQALVEAKDCYLPLSAVAGNPDPSIITISAIPLADPQALRSTCFLGASETLYMSTQSLYLATTAWSYAMPAVDALVYNPEHTTAIHKFALADAGIEYRGSGTVKGHLGWSEDKKSFRMGENGAYLNVVTSIGDTGTRNSDTRLSVLYDSGSGKSLETVRVLDGIGKPGEQLYAARFVGDRAYLVTFRVTDPLYVLDLGDQRNPRIAGELEIDGYSDYLHPLSENLLLGIGKDAIADDGPPVRDMVRGAWPQGVKLALFDVSDPARPREIDSLVLGKRGTESEVLWDHHAFSFLPAQGTEPARFAIPVRLHQTTPQWEGFKPDSPSAWYDYTHSALYSFEASAQGLSQAGRIIAELGGGNGAGVADPLRPAGLAVSLIAPAFRVYGERSVLKDDAVFYLYKGKVLGSLWGETKGP